MNLSSVQAGMLLSPCMLKEYNLKRHYESQHSKSYDQYTAQSRDTLLQELKRALRASEALESQE